MNTPDAILQISVDHDNISFSKESLKDLLFMTLKKGHSLPRAVDLMRLERLAEHAVQHLEISYEKLYSEMSETIFKDN
jgi:hypothetical protein